MSSQPGTNDETGSADKPNELDDPGLAKLVFLLALVVFTLIHYI